jgi:hypothetical protein
VNSFTTIARTSVYSLALLSYSCGQPVPPPSDQLIKDSIKSYKETTESSGIYKVEYVEQTDQYREKDLYFVDIKYDAFFLVGLEEAASMIKEQLSTELEQAEPTSLEDEMVFGFVGMMAEHTNVVKYALMEKFGKFSKRDMIPMVYTLTFTRVDGEWVYQEE